jgi:hypothetical protein
MQRGDVLPAAVCRVPMTVPGVAADGPRDAVNPACNPGLEATVDVVPPGAT